MPLEIAVARERLAGERRVALVPETARKFAALGAAIRMEQSAGIESHFSTPTTPTSGPFPACPKPTLAPA